MDPLSIAIWAVLLFGASALFVIAEYGLLGVRRARMSSLADRGNSGAKLILRALDDRNKYVAGIQLGITVIGIAIGSLIEPVLTEGIRNSLKFLPGWAASSLSLFCIAYPLVVIAELVPKYISIRFAEPVMLLLIRPLNLYVTLTYPFIWLFQKSAKVVLKPFGINIDKHEAESISRDEFQVLLQAGEDEGQFEEGHADVIMKALRLDSLNAKDVMVHRMDIEAISINITRRELIAKLKKVSHSRLLVFENDLDDIKGVIYLQDIVRSWASASERLMEMIRPVEYVPENLPLDRAMQIMQEKRTQILVVQDEYGGTNGMLTLEDVVEEVFGDLQDQLEAEQAPIQRVSNNRIRISPKVRWDELLTFLDLPVNADTSTITLAEMVLGELKSIPVQGDSIETSLGKIVVEQTTRRKIIQLGLHQENP